MKYILLSLLFICGFFASAQTNLNNIYTWAYQLQNIQPASIAADTSFKLIVIDYSANGTDAMKFSSAEISSIKNSGKKAIAYISIGEAENYRTYWQSSWTGSPPSWLGPENPNWAGNFKVKYWDAQWQAIVFNYMDTVIAQGFDGAYMDIIDAYYYWQTNAPLQPNADSLMIDFVLKIRAHVNQQTGNNNFVLMPQNGEDVIRGAHVNTGLKNQFFAAINGVGIEDIFFPGSNAMDNTYAPDTFRLNTLNQFQQNQIPIYSIEYLSNISKILQYKTDAGAHNFRAYTCTRNLDQLCSGIALSINEKENFPAFAIFPNPFSGQLNIQFNATNRSQQLQIFNSIGERILEQEIFTGVQSTTINLSAFNSGLYFLRISDGENSVTTRVIKE